MNEFEFEVDEIETKKLVDEFVQNTFGSKHSVSDYREEEDYLYVVLSLEDGWNRKEINSIIKTIPDRCEVEYIREDRSWQVNIFAD